VTAEELKKHYEVLEQKVWRPEKAGVVENEMKLISRGKRSLFRAAPRH
jgi:hypothetical protein